MRAKDGSAELLSPGGPSMRHPDRGMAPRCWLTEAGPVPWLAEWGLAECPEGRPRPCATIDVARFGVIDRSQLTCFGVVGPTRASVDFTDSNPHIFASSWHTAFR